MLVLGSVVYGGFLFFFFLGIGIREETVVGFTVMASNMSTLESS